MLRTARLAAFVLITLVILGVTAASFAESYRGLFVWAAGHGLHGRWAIWWPLQLDAFIAVGELALFVGLADRWRKQDRIAAWVVTGIGLAASVAANVGHVAGYDIATRLTAGVPPLAAAASLAVGFGVLKRVVGATGAEDTDPAAAVPESDGSAGEAAVPETGDSAVPVLAECAGEADGAGAGQSSGPESAPPVTRKGRKKRRKVVQRIPRDVRAAAVFAALDKEPFLTSAELARRMDCDEATIRRVRKDLVPVTNHD